jgi:hypothetical protein
MIKYDFFRLRINVEEAFSNARYCKEDYLSTRIKISPLTKDNNKLSEFERIIEVRLKLTHKCDPITKIANDSSIPNTAPNRLKRLVVTEEEAIHYAMLNKSDSNVPTFLKAETDYKSALYNYKRSVLTETEKVLDDYKKSMENKKEQIVEFLIGYTEFINGLQLDKKTNGGKPTETDKMCMLCHEDLSGMLLKDDQNNNLIKLIKNQLKSKYTDKNLPIPSGLSPIKSDPYMSKLLDSVMDLLNTENKNCSKIIIL